MTAESATRRSVVWLTRLLVTAAVIAWSVAAFTLAVPILVHVVAVGASLGVLTDDSPIG